AHSVAGPVLEMLETRSTLLAELHHRTDVGRRRDDRELDVRLGDRLDGGRVWELRRVVDFEHRTSPQPHPILDCRRGRNEVELELALQALLDDLEMQQPEKAAAKAEAEGGRVLGLVRERGVIQLQ